MDLISKDTLHFNEMPVVIKEMTSQEMFEYLEGLNIPQFCGDIALILNNTANGRHEVGQQLLFRCSDLTPESCSKLTPSQIIAAADRVKELNPFYFRLRDALLKINEELAAQQAPSEGDGQSSSSEE